MSDQRTSLLLIVLLSFTGASLGVVNKLAVLDVPPLGFVASRVVLSLVFIIPLIIKSKIWQIKNKLKLAAFSLLATTNITLFILGISDTDASIAAAIYMATPIITAILSHYLYHERLSPRKIAGIIAGLVGTATIVLTPVLAGGNLSTGSLRGNLLIFLAVIAFSLHLSLSTKMQREFAPSTITQGFIITASIVLAPLALWEMSTQSFWLGSLGLSSILSILYVSAIGTVGFYFLFQYTIKRASPLITSMSMYLQPIFGVILGGIVFSERLSREFVVGSALALLGVWLVTGVRSRATALQPTQNRRQ